LEIELGVIVSARVRERETDALFASTGTKAVVAIMGAGLALQHTVKPACEREAWRIRRQRRLAGGIDEILRRGIETNPTL
jgi:hypothetical protein